MKGQPLSWTVDERDDATTVCFSGVLDERTNLSALNGLNGKVCFDLSGVNRINSVGVTQWVTFVEDLEGVSELRLVRCSVPVVNQLNMIRKFRGGGQIESFHAPYVSTATGEEQHILLTAADLNDPLKPPTFPCDAGGELVLGDVPERYFHFLAEGSG